MNIYHYNTLVVGAGAAGMNCAVHLYEFFKAKGADNPGDNIAVVTGGLSLGTSRMSGSDKQTYYKMAAAFGYADSPEQFAQTLTSFGCCHEDHAMIEAMGSLREFYHLVRSGVPFPHDAEGAFVGYKTDHDPSQRATSAGPKTSLLMSECLQREVENYGISIFDQQELVDIICIDRDGEKQAAAILTLDKSASKQGKPVFNLYACKNLVLAAGGPGGLYETTVYPQGQTGIHGLCLKAGITAENLSESQFGLASIKFRWNVSGTYMQVVPAIYSTDKDGGDRRDFLAEYFETPEKMASAIFLKGYQWPFDPQRVEDCQSSLIDLLVYKETCAARRVFMDFRENSYSDFDINNLDTEAREYLLSTQANQSTPIERLVWMNQPSIDIYNENGIDLHNEPLEIAVCHQHCNGGMSVDSVWRSNIANVFVIGELAGTHGVKRPGGSALNAGQTGGLRAAEFIASQKDFELPDKQKDEQFVKMAGEVVENLVGSFCNEDGLQPAEVLCEIRDRMTQSAAHVRKSDSTLNAFNESVELLDKINRRGFTVDDTRELVDAVKAAQLAITSAAVLKTIVDYLQQAGGSRGSSIVIDENGSSIHPKLNLKYKPENEELRKKIIRVGYEPKENEFATQFISPRKFIPDERAFEMIWKEFNNSL